MYGQDGLILVDLIQHHRRMYERLSLFPFMSSIQQAFLKLKNGVLYMHTHPHPSRYLYLDM